MQADDAGLALKRAGPANGRHEEDVENNNVNGAAAISVELLMTCLVVAAVFVTRSRFFDAN